MNIEITAGGVVLIIIFAAVIIGWIIYKIAKPKNKEIEEETITAPVENIVYQTEDEEELIAVISAAVAAVLKKPVSGFRVVAFKKRGNWQQQ